MTTELRTMEIASEILNNITLTGDLFALKPAQRVEYIVAFTRRLGLDPATQPIKLIELPADKKTGKIRVIPYADRGCAAQLNQLHGLSHEITKVEQHGDVLLIHDRCTSPDGRFTDEIGAVGLAGWEGKAMGATQLSNAHMHCRTKAMRRATLTHVGLGLLDESEVSTIQGAILVEDEPTQPKGARPALSQPDAPSPNGWDVDALSELELTLERAYVAFKAGGKPEAYEAFAAKWKGRKNEPSEKVLTEMAAFVEKLETAAAKKNEKKAA